MCDHIGHAKNKVKCAKVKTIIESMAPLLDCFVFKGGGLEPAANNIRQSVYTKKLHMLKVPKL
jgi:hypothetical protein